MVQGSPRSQHFCCFILKQFVVPPIRLWQSDQLYFLLPYGSDPSYHLGFFIESYRLVPFQHFGDAFILYLFYTLRVFKTPFLRGFDISYWMFMMPPPKRYDHIIFACVRNLARDHSCLAIGTDFELNQMSIVFSSRGGYFAIECGYFEWLSSHFVSHFQGACSVLV